MGKVAGALLLIGLLIIGIPVLPPIAPVREAGGLRIAGHGGGELL